MNIQIDTERYWQAMIKGIYPYNVLRWGDYEMVNLVLWLILNFFLRLRLDLEN